MAILAVGSMVDYAVKALPKLKENGISAKLVNMRFVKPLDHDLLDEIAKTHRKILAIEENTVVGGFSSAIAEYFIDRNYKNDILRIGLPDGFVDHGTQAELHKLLDIDPEGITGQVLKFVNIDNSIEKVLA